MYILGLSLKINCMKKVMLILIALLCNILCLHAQIPTTGLIGHWNFNGNVKDVSGHGLDGTAYNLTPATGRSGNPNTAYYFNGTSSHVEVPYNSLMNVNTYSICATIKVKDYYTGLCQGNMILERGLQYTSGYYLLDYCDNFWDSSCNVTGDTTRFIFNTGLNGKPAYNLPWQYTPVITSGQWYCVVGTFDGTVYKLYINGVLKSTVTPYQSLQTGISTEGITMGSAYNYSSPGLYPYWLNAYVDDICLYNRALTATEVGSYCGTAYQQSNEAYIMQPLKSNNCKGDTIHLNYGITGSFNPGNVFTAQLSDATGSFASPTNIGSITSNIPGMIICTLPGSITAGTAYRIRIVSSSPASTSSDNGFDIGISLPATISTTVAPGDTICAGITATFTATLTNAVTGAGLQWKVNGSSVPGANGMVFTSNALVNNDYVTVDVVNANSCTPFLSSGITMTVTDKTIPAVSIEVTPDTNVWPGLQVTFKAIPLKAGKNPKYQWQKNLTIVKGATDSIWSTTDLKDGDVVGCALTSDNPCSTIKYVVSKRVTMHLPTSIKDINNTNEIALYPNPNKGIFNLKGRTNGAKELNIEIINAVGQVVYKEKLTLSGAEFDQQINLNRMENGIYLLKSEIDGVIKNTTFTIAK
jgi:hypothetical protein